MKKLLSLFLAALLLLSLAACGGTPASPSGVVSGNSGTGSQAPAEASVAETVLVDTEGIKITAKGLENDGLFGSSLKLLIENNSGKDLTVQARNASVNGYMVETMLSADVVNGKKANDTLTFSSSSLEAAGIKAIADMEFSFHIFTTSDWETYLDTPQIQIKTSIADTYQYSYDDSGEVAYNQNGVKIVIKGLSKEDSLLGPGIVVYMENTGDKDLTVQTRDVSINGFMVDAIFSSDVMVGKRAVDSITFMDSDLEENGITEITEVELSFHIFTMEGWDTIADTEAITITF